jgi:hypothetical protein
MTLQAIQNYTAVNNDDITTPSSTQKYVLGLEVMVNTGDGYPKIYKYVKSHGALTLYQPYVLGVSSTDGSQVITEAPATLAAPGQLVVIPQVAFTSGYYGFVLKQGDGKVLMTAETYAIGDYLQVLTAGTALVVDGTTGSTVRLVNSCAICKEAGTTAVARKMYLIGEKAVTAAT